MKGLTDIIKQLTMLTQFGLSLITPLFICLGICWWICSRFGVGGWVYIIGFFFGIGSSGMVAYKLYLQVLKQQEKEKQTKKNISFNRHI